MKPLTRHDETLSQSDHVPAERRWRARPVQSTLLRLLVLLLPAAACVAVGAALIRAFPPPDGLSVIPWWAFLVGTSLVVASVVERLARRLLPLTVLLKLSLIFPDRAPSRFAMARRTGNVRVLRERIRQAHARGVEDDPARAAETILTLVAALSGHDRKTRGHSERVRAFTDLLAEELSLTPEDRDRLRWAALLHDIGKLQVPERILNKPGKPDKYEWETLQRHPEEGARLAAPLLPWLGEWGLAIGQHHERYDGKGYPRGLSGEDISRSGRIVNLTDAFETMTAARSYKKPMSVSAARKELAACAGTQFDPSMVRAFLNIALGRLWWKIGPLSWLAQVPLLGELQRAGGQAVTAAEGAAGVVAKGVAGIIVLGGITASPRPPDRPPVVVSETRTKEVANRLTWGDTTTDASGPVTETSGSDNSGVGSKSSGSGTTGSDSSGTGGGSTSGTSGTGDGSGTSTSGSDGSGSGSGSDPVGTVTQTVNQTTEQVTSTVDSTTDQAVDTVTDTTTGLLP